MLRCRSFLPVSGFSYMPCTAPLRATLEATGSASLPGAAAAATSAARPSALAAAASTAAHSLRHLRGTSRTAWRLRGKGENGAREENVRNDKNLVFQKVFWTVESSTEGTCEISCEISSQKFPVHGTAPRLG